MHNPTPQHTVLNAALFQRCRHQDGEGDMVPEELHAGTYSMVYKGTYNGSIVAAKKFRTESCIGPEKLEAEAAVLQTLSYRHIVPVLGVVHVNRNVSYLLTEFVDGPSLFHFIQEKNGLDRRTTIAIGGQLVKATNFLWLKGILHCDIKPNNVLCKLRQDPLPPRIILVDFGSAAVVGTTTTFTTRPGSPVFTGGTEVYMAPELFEADPHPSPSAEVYSLGLVIYQCLTNQLPRGTARSQQDLRHVAQTWMPPSTGHPDIDHFISQCAALRPSDRPKLSAMTDLLDNLPDICSSFATPTPLSAATEPPHRIDEMSTQPDSPCGAIIGVRGRACHLAVNAYIVPADPDTGRVHASLQRHLPMCGDRYVADDPFSILEDGVEGGTSQGYVMRWSHDARRRWASLRLVLEHLKASSRRGSTGSIALALEETTRLQIADLRAVASRQRIDIVVCTDDTNLLTHIYSSVLGWGRTDFSPRMLSLAEELAEELSAGRVDVFTGAGLGIAAGGVGWSTLLDRVEGGHVDGPQPVGHLERAQSLSDQLGDPEFKRQVCKMVDLRQYSVQHGLLAVLPSIVLTQNYDCLHELAMADVDGELPDVIPGRRNQRGRRRLVKLHGSVEQPDSVVITARDYERSNSSEMAALQSFLQQGMLAQRLLVMGFSLADPNFTAALQSVLRCVEHTQDHAQSSDVVGTRITALMVPAIPDDVDEWKVQGVDMTSFATGRELELWLQQVVAMWWQRQQRGTTDTWEHLDSMRLLDVPLMSHNMPTFTFGAIREWRGAVGGSPHSGRLSSAHEQRRVARRTLHPPSGTHLVYFAFPTSFTHHKSRHALFKSSCPDDPVECLHTLGGFVYVDASERVLAVRALAWGDHLHFGAAITVAEDTLEALRLQRVTWQELRSKGARRFCWVPPGKCPALPPNQAGAFVYEMEGDLPPKFFPVLPSPNTPEDSDDEVDVIDDTADDATLTEDDAAESEQDAKPVVIDDGATTDSWSSYEGPREGPSGGRQSQTPGLQMDFTYLEGRKNPKPKLFDRREEACWLFHYFHGDVVMDGNGDRAVAIGVRPMAGHLYLWFHVEGMEGAGVYTPKDFKRLRKVGRQPVLECAEPPVESDDDDDDAPHLLHLDILRLLDSLSSGTDDSDAPGTDDSDAPGADYFFPVGTDGGRRACFDRRDSTLQPFGFKHGDVVETRKDPKIRATVIGVRLQKGEPKLWFHPHGCGGAGLFDQDSDWQTTAAKLRRVGHIDVVPIPNGDDDSDSDEDRWPRLPPLQYTSPYACGTGLLHGPENFDRRDEVCSVFGFRSGERVTVLGKRATAIGLKPDNKGKVRIWFHQEGNGGAGLYGKTTLRRLRAEKRDTRPSVPYNSVFLYSFMCLPCSDVHTSSTSDVSVLEEEHEHAM